MSSLTRILTATAIALLVLVPIAAEDTDAEGIAKVYFINADNKCIAQVYLVPGEPIGGANIPYHGDYMEWYDEHGVRVYGPNTFSAGDHIVRAYPSDDPPGTSEDGPDRTTVMFAVTWIAIAAVAGLSIYLYRRR